MPGSGRTRQYQNAAERARAWRERQKTAAGGDTTEEGEMRHMVELEDELVAVRGALAAAQEEAVAAREALASTSEEAAAAQSALAAAREEVADLRTQAAVSAARHAGELATAQAVADERQRQIDTLRADLAEAHKAATSAGQEPKKRERHYTSAERFDPDVLHQEVLQKWFKYADEHPNPVPPEERTRRVVREIIAAGKAKEAAGAQKATEATAATEVPDTTETPEVPVADAAAASDWRGHLRHRLGL